MLFRICLPIVSLLTLGNCSDAIPDVHSELIPGPGFPSLASLNLTTADLLEWPIVRGSSAQTATSDNTLVCGPEDRSYTDVNNLISCFNYLRILGKTLCEFDSREARTVCWHGFNGVVVGISTTDQRESSYCIDLAWSVLAVIDGCTRLDHSCAGFAVANGNGNIMVGGTNADYENRAWV